MVAINLFPQVNHLADKPVVTLTGCAVLVQLAFGAEFNTESSSVRRTFRPFFLILTSCGVILIVITLCTMVWITIYHLGKYMQLDTFKDKTVYLIQYVL